MHKNPLFCINMIFVNSGHKRVTISDLAPTNRTPQISAIAAPQAASSLRNVKINKEIRILKQINTIFNIK